MAIIGLPTSKGISVDIGTDNERVRKPWAIVLPNGVWAASSGFTWMNW
jgi:hypothetical protein